ncbi:fibrinogen-like protein 1 [Anomaloglossus baeobatrachus]|uniref:fibrinogen-like protein 1 n=1 Tax=Anomaloglossus baeobatrachus TaxID=238106 RepID=UPI003F4FD951
MFVGSFLVENREELGQLRLVKLSLKTESGNGCGNVKTNTSAGSSSTSKDVDSEVQVAAAVEFTQAVQAVVADAARPQLSLASNSIADLTLRYNVKKPESNLYNSTTYQAAQGYDCSNIWQKNNSATSGIYMIKPRNAICSFKVYCEMSENGGWTLIQKHNGEDNLDFFATWKEYQYGFGDLKGEHWLGLEYIYALTHQTQRPSKLNISLGDFDGNEAYAEYRSFSIGEAKKFYKLAAANYSGTAGDAFLGFSNIPGSREHGSYFSTWDNYHDNCHEVCGTGDEKYQSCSDQYQSGWWFNACGLANLNGVWHAPPRHLHRSTSVSWPSWKFAESLKFSKMYLIYN